MMKRWMIALLAAHLAMAAHAQSAVVKTDEVRAELVAQAPEGVSAGKPLWLGLVIEHAPHWHTYWKNPGDSGLPTTLTWQLPAGVSAGEIAWPTPKRLPVGPLVNYGYEDKLLLPVPVEVASDFKGDTLNIKLSAQWLVCKDVCIPQQGEFVLRLPANATTAAHGALFNATWAAQPKEASAAQVSAELVDGAKAMRMRIAGLPAALQGKELSFFAEAAGVIDHAAKVTGAWDGVTWSADVAISPQRFESPSKMHAVLTAPGQAAGTRVGFAIAGAWPALTPPTPPAVLDTAAAAVSPPPPDFGFGAALLFAVIGGALLNLMPCVFPILSLKVLGFAGHAHSRRALVGGGLAYTAGVVLSFGALAGLLIALRAGGEQIGWGFQLQSPGFVAALAVLFTLIALNLAGLFEFATVLPSGLASMQLRHPRADSFLTGVLAVAVASPCTAPFMGAALGFAFTLPAAQSLLLFAVLGLGMALPYLVMSLWPAVARAMPKPGAWMATFKTVMAFPMLATVVWLVWVLGQQTSIDGAAALLAVLVALAFALWAWGRVDSTRGARMAWSVLGVALLGLSIVWALPTWREAQAAPAAASSDQRWQAWSPERVAALNAEGRTVFVDFTAAWCVTCQVNKRSTLNDATLMAEMDAARVALLRADWTRRDATISNELSRLGRNGVPVYAIYRPGHGANQQPTLLPELLSVSTVRDALALPRVKESPQ
jgi:thiol:disulfide interchange protein/DsbC/DsbD-like thiol-disulfide interchange protein